MKLSNCYDSVINHLLSIAGDTQKIAKFSFFNFGEIDPIDIYALGLKFHYGQGVIVDLDIALNCYEYAHTGYDDVFQWEFYGDGISINKIESPTHGTSILITIF